MNVSDFHFDLPDELIARYPLKERSASRLLSLDGLSGDTRHLRFTDLPGLLQPGDLLVFNDTRVIPARLFGRKETGGQVEVLVERVLGEHDILAHVRASKALKEGQKVLLEDGTPLRMSGRDDALFHLHCDSDEPVLEVLERIARALFLVDELHFYDGVDHNRLVMAGVDLTLFRLGDRGLGASDVSN